MTGKIDLDELELLRYHDNMTWDEIEREWEETYELEYWPWRVRKSVDSEDDCVRKSVDDKGDDDDKTS